MPTLPYLWVVFQPAEEDSGGAEEESRRGRRLGLQPDLVAHSVTRALVPLCKQEDS